MLMFSFEVELSLGRFFLRRRVRITVRRDIDSTMNSAQTIDINIITTMKIHARTSPGSWNTGGTRIGPLLSITLNTVLKADSVDIFSGAELEGDID